MFGFNTYLIEENKSLREQNRELQLRLLELVDAKIFNRLPERLTVTEPPKPNGTMETTNRPSDAYSAAIEDAVKNSQTLEGENQ